jgi:hypothetical protein
MILIYKRNDKFETVRKIPSAFAVSKRIARRYRGYEGASPAGSSGHFIRVRVEISASRQISASSVFGLTLVFG